MDAENSNLASVENADSAIQRPLESSCLAELIWKYFEPEIREALLDAQESLNDDNDKRTEQLSNRMQVGK
jgi:hypothetical protein